MPDKQRLKDYAVGAAIGAAAGAIAALFLTPKTGNEMRKAVSEQLHVTLEKTQKMASSLGESTKTIAKSIGQTTTDFVETYREVKQRRQDGESAETGEAAVYSQSGLANAAASDGKNDSAGSKEKDLLHSESSVQ